MCTVFWKFRSVHRVMVMAVLGFVTLGAKCDSEPKSTAPTVRINPQLDSRPAPMKEPVDHWKGGQVVGKVDALDASFKGHMLVDLGEEWTPYLFTERGSLAEDPMPNAYRKTYIALAQGRFPDNHHGERARRDKYLELYGILPTLKVLRARIRLVKERRCGEKMDVEPLNRFEGYLSYQNNHRARTRAKRFIVVERQVTDMMKKHGVATPEELRGKRIGTKGERRLRDYLRGREAVFAIRAAQDRLDCEGFFVGKGKYMRGALDWATHEALAEFERRYRIYGWGVIGSETLRALRLSPMENERRSVVRVLTERAMLAAGVVEDGSARGKGTKLVTFKGRDGKTKTQPNLEAQIRKRVVQAFGLQTPESAWKFLEHVGDLGRHYMVSVEGPAVPEYYRADMDLFVSIDRGDVWYEFPFDEQGEERSQPVRRRPRVTVFTRYLDQRIPLARFGTTIGGWRSELIEGRVMWKYKQSPPGERIWTEIVASPVWLPPDGTPREALMVRNPGGQGKDRYRVNYHETGPSYASAYGLVAAYHKKFRKFASGEYRLGGDEGIRTHGSVDYMSIMRRHSHGCHRMHNHLAVRLMSFVLAHRPHDREGQQSVSFYREWDYKQHRYELHITKGGYVFKLRKPVHVYVREGSIRGRVKNPVLNPIPKYDPDAGVYIDPDAGTPVRINRRGQMEAIPWPDAGVDGSVDGELPKFVLPGVTPTADGGVTR